MSSPRRPDIDAREFSALLGVPGCDTPRLPRMLAGFEHPTEGGNRVFRHAGRNFGPLVLRGVARARADRGASNSAIITPPDAASA